MQRRAFLSGVLAFSVIPRAYAASFQFPDVLGSTEEGKETHLSTVLQSYSGRPLLLHAWASYCQPCIADIPLLKELEQSLPVLGLYLIARSFEENTKMIQKIHNNEYGKNLLLEGSSQKIFKEKYEEQTRNKFVIPTYFLLSSDGECVSIEEGTLGSKKRLERITKTIEGLL